MLLHIMKYTNISYKVYRNLKWQIKTYYNYPQEEKAMKLFYKGGEYKNK